MVKWSLMRGEYISRRLGFRGEGTSSYLEGQGSGVRGLAHILKVRVQG